MYATRQLIALPFLMLGLDAAAPAAAQDRVPALDVAPACRSYSATQPDPQSGFKSCMDQEQSARAQLEKTWSQYAGEDRQRCLDTTNELGGKTASYVELLECVIMAKDARSLEKTHPSDLDLSIGQGR